MKVIQLIRPALDPRRDLELRMREAQNGLADFVLGMAPPTGWLEVELLDATEPTPQTMPSRSTRRA